MNDATWLPAVLGGALIGLASAGLFLLLGRIAGVSGIFGDLLLFPRRQPLWRACFVLGLPLGYGLYRYLDPSAAAPTMQVHTPGLVLAGLLVGYGTRLGCGCTSGHGICGLARISPRSMAATALFMGVAMLVALLMRTLELRP